MAMSLLPRFTARRYASAVYAVALCLCLSQCPSVSMSMSVTSRFSTKTTKLRIKQTTPLDSPGRLIFLTPKISAKFDRSKPLRGAECREMLATELS